MDMAEALDRLRVTFTVDMTAAIVAMQNIMQVLERLGALLQTPAQRRRSCKRMVRDQVYLQRRLRDTRRAIMGGRGRWEPFR